jgi:hypothetical protein
MITPRGGKKDTMSTRMRLWMTALVVLTVLAFAVGSATANRSLEFRGGPGVSAEGTLTFDSTTGEFETICNVTLRSTVASRVSKTAGTLFGRVTGISFDRGGAGTERSPNCRHAGIIREVHDIIPLIGPGRPCTHSEDRRGRLTYDCTGAEARLWKLIYDSFQGTLPRITGFNIHIQNVQHTVRLLDVFGVTQNCLYEGNIFALVTVNAEGTITRARAVRERTALPRISGGAFCPERGTLSGEFSVRPTLTIALL